MSRKINELKQKILSTAIDLIKKNGYDSVTLQDICIAANISKTTFYYHFKSKEDLLISYYEVPMEMIRRNLGSVILEEDNIEQYWKLVEPMLDFILDNGTEITKHMLYALTNQNIPAFNPSKSQGDNVDIGVAIIKRAQSSGIMRNASDPFLLVSVAQSQLLGIILSWCTTNGEFDLKDAIRLSIEVCFDVKPELRKAPDNVFFGI